jgi:hypothetical protein
MKKALVRPQFVNFVCTLEKLVLGGISRVMHDYNIVDAQMKSVAGPKEKIPP